MRRKGKPMYPKKSVIGSYYLTTIAAAKMRAAAKRTGKSESDVIEHCLRESADGLTRERASELAESGTI